MTTTNTPSIQYTNKLFYGEYAYSCTVNFYDYSVMHGRNAPLTRYTLKHIVNNYSTWDEATKEYGWVLTGRHENIFKRIWEDRDEWVHLITWLDDNERSAHSWEMNLRIRVEGAKVSFYFLTENVFEDFLTSFPNNILTIHRPISETRAQYIRHNPKDMIVKKFPYKNFRYKLIWQDKHKLGDDKKQAFLKWCMGFDKDSMKITNQLKDFLNKKSSWYNNSAYGAYMYVRDDFALSMINLYLSETGIFKVKKYVLEKDIEKKELEMEI